MIDYFELLRTLKRHDVRFVVVGGVAAALQGVPVQTLDLDIVHERTPDNVAALLAALDELEAVARHHPQRPRPNATHLEGPGHLLLSTKQGSFDVLGSIDGGATYEDLIAHAHPLDLEGLEVWVIDLEHLLGIKRRTGRAKDLAVVPLIEHVLALAEEE